ncbi:MAG TPA: hypothetical protein VHG08_06040 [Longimicrobium sp.]|nr:hypothetical protein [Longimicrobium sp.]
MASRFRLILVLFAVLGCTPAPPAPSPAAPATVMRICVLHHGELVDVRAEQLASGDTVVEGRPFSRVYADTGQYAATHSWYVENEPIDYDHENVCYVKYGRPRYVAAESLVRLGRWRGVTVFRERAGPGLPEVLMVPVGAGCMFQLYQYMPSMPPRSCPQPARFEIP